MRLTKKEKQIDCDYVACVEYLGIVEKLGQLEDILEKYGIDDIEKLDKILEVRKFLLEHNYQTLPKEDFDALFNELERRKDDKLNIK